MADNLENRAIHWTLTGTIKAPQERQRVLAALHRLGLHVEEITGDEPIAEAADTRNIPDYARHIIPAGIIATKDELISFRRQERSRTGYRPWNTLRELYRDDLSVAEHGMPIKRTALYPYGYAGGSGLVLQKSPESMVYDQLDASSLQRFLFAIDIAILEAGGSEQKGLARMVGLRERTSGCLDIWRGFIATKSLEFIQQPHEHFEAS